MTTDLGVFASELVRLCCSVQWYAAEKSVIDTADGMGLSYDARHYRFINGRIKRGASLPQKNTA
jgi:hypothetical protein